MGLSLLEMEMNSLYIGLAKNNEGFPELNAFLYNAR